MFCADRSLLITDGRYIQQADQETQDFEVVALAGNMWEQVAGLLQETSCTSLGIESDHLNYQQYLQLQKALGSLPIQPFSGLIERLRSVKDDTEVAAIKSAVALVDKVFPWLQRQLQPGKKEAEIALELEYQLKKQGAKELAFKIILAAGENSALPHFVPTERCLHPGDLVLLDCGVTVDGYCSDFSRTMLIGAQEQQWHREIYHAVLMAQQRGIQAIREGVNASAVDQEVRETIASYGYAEYFTHSTGHGVGLEVHERPVISKMSEDVLKAGMVVTVEPGIYLPGRGGVRIEDMVLVTSAGCEVLTSSPKEDLVCIS